MKHMGLWLLGSFLFVMLVWLAVLSAIAMFAQAASTIPERVAVMEQHLIQLDQNTHNHQGELELYRAFATQVSERLGRIETRVEDLVWWLRWQLGILSSTLVGFLGWKLWRKSS